MPMTTRMLAFAEKLWAKGVPMKDIASACDVPIHTLRYYTTSNRDMFPARRKSARLTEEQKAEIIRLRKEGFGAVIISRKVGCSKNTAARLIKGVEYANHA